MTEAVQTREMKLDEAGVCESNLRSLPRWFGIEEAVVEYCYDLRRVGTYVAVVDGEAVGFVTLNQHNPYTAEIHLIAIRESSHRKGIVKRLVAHAEEWARSKSAEFLEVKTLGPSKPDSNYDKTREFYVVLGFRLVEETALWSKEKPCLIMIEHLSSKD